MIHQHRLRIFNECLDQYSSDQPLSKFLKEFYKQHKQMGSNDRRHLSNLMYSYFRIGNSFAELERNERLYISLFITQSTKNDFLFHFKPEWESSFDESLSNRINFISTVYAFKLNDIFPLYNHISKEIEKDDFLKSHFIQPDLFIRCVKGKQALLKSYLDTNNISYYGEDLCYRLINQTNLPESKEYIFEIQDKSSQQTIQFMHPKLNEYWWDCCAASGGKSLLLKEQEPNCYLMCSDVRESVLKNLDERFQKAGITKYKRRLIDLLSEIHSFETETFDGIVMDAPCTGSGTWSRTPERICQVDEQNLAYFSNLQSSIADNAIQFLKNEKEFIYITCSVFELENEVVVNKLAADHKLKIKHMQYIKGYHDKADTMFIAVLMKP